MKNKWHDEILSGKRYPVHWILFLIFFNWFHIISPVWAARAYKPEIADPVLEPWRWTSFPELNGKGFKCMAETKDGSMWFGVDKGAIRYDGFTWTRYSSQDGLVGQTVLALCALKDGSLLAGTESGVSVFKDGLWTRVFPLNGQFSWATSVIRESSDGSIWSGGMSSVLRIRDNTFTVYAASSTLDSLKAAAPDLHYVVLPQKVIQNRVFHVTDIMEDRAHRIWFGLIDGFIVRIDGFNPNDDAPSSWTVFTEKTNIYPVTELKFCQMKDGSVWIASYSPMKGISRYDGRDWTTIPISKSVESNSNSDILETTDGAVWVGGFCKMYCFRNGTWHTYDNTKAPIPQTKINLFKKSDGSLWVAGLNLEVQRLDYATERWTTYKGLNFQCETPDGIQWFVSVDGSVVCRNGDRWIRYHTEDGLMDRAFSLLVTRQGVLWAAGSHHQTAAASRLNGQKWTRHMFPRLCWGVEYRAMFEAGDGSLWFGSCANLIKERDQHEGVVRFYPATHANGLSERWIHYAGPEHPTWVYGIGQTANGILYFASNGRIVTFDGETWSQLSEPIELKQDMVDAVCSTKDGQLWLGTRSYGVLHFNGDRWTRYSSENGLNSNSITSILAAPDSSIWMATVKDICRFDGQSWTANIFPQQLNIVREGGSLKQSKNGGLWINRASRSWYRLSYPNTVPEKETYSNFWTVCYQRDLGKPRTRLITTVDHVSQPGNMVLSWEGRDPWRSTPDEELEYSYQMDDGNWSPFAHQTNRTFLSLPSGKHVFQVRARDRDFNVDPNPATIRFTVAPPFWRHPVVIALLGLLVLSVATGITLVLRRDAKLKDFNTALEQSNRELDQSNTELEQAQNLLTNANLNLQRSNTELEQFAYVASHDLQEPLRMVTGYMSLLSKRYQEKLGEDAKEFIGFAVDGAKRMQQLINDLLSYSRVSTQGKPLVPTDSEDVFTHMVQNLKVAIEESGAKVTHDPLPTVKADGGQLDRLLQNLVGNAIKYRDKQTIPDVHVSVVRQDQEWIFSIRDNGIGIDPQFYEKIFGIFQRLHTREEYSGTGIGLAVCKKIVERHGGRIWVESEEGKGSIFKFTMPVDRSAGSM